MSPGLPEKGMLNMTATSSPKIVISGSGIWTPPNVMTNTMSGNLIYRFDDYVMGERKK